MSRTSKDGFPVRLIGLHNITVNHDLQSRVATSPEYQREFSEAMLSGAVFPPVTVFYDEAKDKYYLADGFHRYGAAFKANFTEIECEIRTGKKRDALVFAAGANKKFSIPRKPEDIRRACEMLFADPVWSGIGNAAIGKHVGVNDSTVKKYRVLYYESLGTPYPEVFNDKNGNQCVANRSQAPSVRKSSQSKRKTRYRYHTGNSYIDLGTSKARADLELKKLQEEKQKRKNLFTSDKLERYLVARCIPAVRPGFSTKSHPGIYGFVVRDHFVTWTPIEQPEDVVHAVGRAILGSIIAGVSGREIVLCDPDNTPNGVIDMARQSGVEFITPEDFVASLENEQGSQLRAAQ